jgi:hypothetical protein
MHFYCRWDLPSVSTCHTHREKKEYGREVKEANMAMVANMAGCSGCTAMKIPFLYWELRSLSLNFHINVSVSNFYISRIGPHISCSRMQIDCVNIKISTDTRMWKSGL